MRFEIQKNHWAFLSLIACTLIAPMFFFFAETFTDKMVLAVVFLGLDLPFFILFVWVYARTYLLINNQNLTAYFGPFVYRVPLADIRSLEVVRKKWWKTNIQPPAISFRQIHLTYGRYGVIKVSAPKDEEAFIQELKRRTPLS
ncbi:PH domain-containing protein [Alteribacter populi]|uniref:PH domain-containing protein n=1 Tax=Alteribacter populi TaxID=2011011 RepID=UPI000BBAB2F0|nr:PH domain-containing protein [Alteribacter populi]